MKRFLQKFLALMMVLWTSSQLSAQDFTVDGINYSVISEEDKTVEVAKYLNYEDRYTGDIVIPEKVEYNKVNYTVIAVGDEAFFSCDKLMSIELPTTINHLGICAFYKCSSLSSIILPESISTLGKSAFEESGITSINLPNSITDIGDAAFKYCNKLTSVVIPDLITVIKENTFELCTSLTSVTFPKSLTTVKTAAFRGCILLSSAIFDESLTSLEYAAFVGCKALTTLDFSKSSSLTTIGWGVFEECESLEKIVFPKSLTKVERNAFANCPQIKYIESLSKSPEDISIENDVFSDKIYPVATLKVPAEAFSAYVATEPWSNFLTIESIEGEKVTLKEATAEVIAGNSIQLSATVTGASALTWSSDDESIATVDATGKVTGVAEGEVLIRATSNAARSTCTVSVKVIHAENIELNEIKYTLEKGKTLELKATITPAEHSDEVKWTSSNEEVATVNQNGVVTAVNKGFAKITVTAGTAKAECDINVVIPATAITLEDGTATIEKGKTLKLIAKVTPEDTTDDLIWRSDNEEVATVDKNGVVTAVNKGEATITVTAGAVSATSKVTVVIPATDIELDKKEATIEKGETLILEVTVVPEDTTDKLVWTSEDENVATVDEKGVVTAVAVGTTKITVTAGKVSASCDVTVIISAKEIALDKDEATIEKGETLTLTPTVVPEDTTDKLVWTSEDENIATVNENGVVTAVAVGTTKITVTAGKVSTFCDVTVVISAKDITLDKTEANIEKGKTLELKATVNPEDTTDKLVWTSEDDNVAAVDENGVVTAVAPGTAKITVTAGKVSASCDVTVVISMTGIELDKTEAEGYIGGTVKLTATVKPEDTTDDTTVTWTSSDEEVATVDENGLVSCLAEGEAVITATCGEFWAECTVTVTDRPPFVAITSLELSESEIELALNFTYSLFAIIAPENATDTELEWSSSDINVARVYEGVVYGIVPGEAVITAKTTDGSNLSASCKVTIVETSGIDGIEGDGVKVTEAAGVITVKGAAAGSTVEVYSMSGACVAAKTVESSTEEFPIAASGIYVVRVNGKTFKVAL